MAVGRRHLIFSLWRTDATDGANPARNGTGKGNRSWRIVKATPIADRAGNGRLARTEVPRRRMGHGTPSATKPNGRSPGPLGCCRASSTNMWSADGFSSWLGRDDRSGRADRSLPGRPTVGSPDLSFTISDTQVSGRRARPGFSLTLDGRHEGVNRSTASAGRPQRTRQS
jgi:hypothetical protein